VTLIPFDELPECAKLCGQLFDVNGACVPPSKPTFTDDQMKDCFCSDPRVAGFKESPSGVCDPPCTGSDNKDDTLKAIQSWYGDFCGIKIADNPDPAATGAGASSEKSNSGGGDW